MTTRATGTYTTKSWEEGPYQEAEGTAKLSRASVVNEFDGDLKGDGVLDYLLVYLPDNSARYVGLQRFAGHIGAKEGTFVARIQGEFTAVAGETWTIVEGSGTGELSTISGTASVRSIDGVTAKYEIEYEL